MEPPRRYSPFSPSSQGFPTGEREVHPSPGDREQPREEEDRSRNPHAAASLAEGLSVQRGVEPMETVLSSEFQRSQFLLKHLEEHEVNFQHYEVLTGLKEGKVSAFLTTLGHPRLLPIATSFLTAAPQLIDEVASAGKKRNTPLEFAVRLAAPESLQFLFDRGADPKKSSVPGETLMHFFCSIEFEDENLDNLQKMLAIVVKHHPELIHIPDQRGRTGMHLLASQGLTNTLVRLLPLIGGADQVSHHIDNEGFNPGMIARIHRRDGILKLLNTPFSRAWEEIKMLVHRWGVDHTVQIGDRRLECRGLHPMITFPLLTESVQNWSDQPSSQPMVRTFQKAEWSSIVATLKNTLPKDADAVIQLDGKRVAGEVVAMATGWKTHATGVVLYAQFQGKQYFLKCNRGQGSPSHQAGIHCYQVKRAERIRDCMESFLKAQHDSTGTYFLSTVDQELQLEHIPEGYIRHTHQQFDTCAWASAKLVFEGVVFLKLLQQGRSLEESKQLASKIYKAWTTYDRQEALFQFQQRKHPQFGHNIDLYQQALITKIEKEKIPEVKDGWNLLRKSGFSQADIDQGRGRGRTALHLAMEVEDGFLHQRIVTNLAQRAPALLNLEDPKEGLNPIQMACEQRRILLIQVLVENGCDLTVKTGKQENILHLICQLGKPNDTKELEELKRLVIAIVGRDASLLKGKERTGKDPPLEALFGSDFAQLLQRPQ